MGVLAGGKAVAAGRRDVGRSGVWEVEGQVHMAWLRTPERQPSVGKAFCDSGVLSSQLTVSCDICADAIDRQQEENSRCLGNQLMTHLAFEAAEAMRLQ